MNNIFSFDPYIHAHTKGLLLNYHLPHNSDTDFQGYPNYWMRKVNFLPLLPKLPVVSFHP